MSNVTPIYPAYLRLDVGIWRKPGESGRGKKTYWLEYVMADDSTIIVWSGYTYRDALEAAKGDTAYGMRFVDLVAHPTGGLH